MATIFKRKDKDGKYHVKIRRTGFSTKTKDFRSLKDARAWARLMEGNLDRQNISGRDKTKYSLTTLVSRYINVVLTYKQQTTRETESIILRAFLQNCKFAHLNINDIKPFHFARYRDERLSRVKPSTLNRELGVLNHLYSVADTEWDMNIPNPLRRVKKPRVNNKRDRVMSAQEYQWLLDNANKDLRDVITIAMETAMRRTEITNIRREDIRGFTLVIPKGKTGKRTIPLTLKVMKVLKERELPFKIRPRTISWNFLMLCRIGGIKDLRFHDIRHSSLTEYSKRLSVQELMVISGHSNLKMLSRYVNLKATDLIEKINFGQKKLKVLK